MRTETEIRERLKWSRERLEEAIKLWGGGWKVKVWEYSIEDLQWVLGIDDEVEE